MDQSPSPHRSTTNWEGMHHGKGYHSLSHATGAVLLPTTFPMPTNQAPMKWSRDEVHDWLKWCQEEFALDSVNVEKFNMNGKALCIMPMQAFRDRAPESGDVLYELLQKLFRKECKFYHPSSEQEGSSSRRRSPEVHSYFSGSPMSSSRTERVNAARSPMELMRLERACHGSATSPPNNPSPRLPIDLSAPDKPNTPCSDSGHSSPDMAEDLRLAGNGAAPSTGHMRRHNVPPMITLTPSSQGSLQGMYREEVHHMMGRGNPHDAPDGFVGDASVPASPKRLKSDFLQGHHIVAAIYPRDDGHIELCHRQETADRLVHKRRHDALHDVSPARSLSRRMSSEDSMAPSGPLPSFPSDRIGPLGLGLGGAYHHGSTVPVSCAMPSITAGSALLTQLQYRRNSTSGAEGIGDGFSPSPQHSLPVGSLPRRRSMDLDDVFLMEEETFETRKAAGGDCRLLWDFLVQLLKNKTYTPYIRWEDRRERVFRILDPVQIANLWGLQKNRTNMTYEKLSRALRYYYKMGILQKEQGQKLTYRFLQDPKDIANSQRFSKLTRNKDAMDHPEVTGSSSSSSSASSSSSSSLSVHSHSSSPMPSPSSMSISSALSASTSVPVSAMSLMASSAVLSPSATPSATPSGDQRRLFTRASGVPNEDARSHTDDPYRKSPNVTPGASNPPAPAATLDDPVAVATNRSIEGVSMMALSSRWQESSQGSEVEGQSFRVKEEPRSRSISPAMES